MSTLSDALSRLPVALALPLQRYVQSDRDVADVVGSMLTRSTMAPDVALMAGLALTPDGRDYFDGALQRLAEPLAPLPTDVREVVVGGGVHAAIYASVRRSLGFAPPLVIDSRERFGGTFAVGSSRDGWYLNSRNRPGAVGEPGTAAALNALPSAPMQPSDIGGGEYQTNGDIALTVRCALALNATVRTATVDTLDIIGNGVAVGTSRGRVIADRVIVASGIGGERYADGVGADDDVVGSPVYGFGRWFERVAVERFPLNGLGRVAVIGGGDGARCVIESMTGIGPSSGLSVAALDYVERLDWYGAPALTRDAYCASSRTRYARIGALLPRVDGQGEPRVRPFVERADSVVRRFDSVLVNGRTYDTVVLATGYADGVPSIVNAAAGSRTLAAVRRDGSVAGSGFDIAAVGRGIVGLAPGDVDRGTAPVIVVGPAAALPFADVNGDAEAGSRIGENAVGIYRYAPRTAALAASLPS